MRLVALVTFLLVALLGMMLSLPPRFRKVEFSEPFWRAIAVVAILDSLGTILVPLVYWLFHRHREVARAHEGVVGYAGAQPQSAIAPVATATATAPAPTPAPATSVPGMPPPEAYAPWAPGQPKLRLKWPQYEDGRPLPRKPDGTPGFTGVVGS